MTEKQRELIGLYNQTVLLWNEAQSANKGIRELPYELTERQEEVEKKVKTIGEGLLTIWPQVTDTMGGAWMTRFNYGGIPPGEYDTTTNAPLKFYLLQTEY